MNSPSPTSSINSNSNNSLINARNGPQSIEYLRSHKGISLSYPEGFNTFQQGELGDSDSYLVGTLHLNYSKPCQVKSVYLYIKGTEKTQWYKSQARTKTNFGAEYTLVDQSNKIWEAFDDVEEIKNIDIPFKIQLPYNLPDSIVTEFGSVQYVLRATVNTKSLIGAQQTVKLVCPLRRTIILDNQATPPFKFCGETQNGIDYTFILPPNKCFNVGSYVSIPLKLRFLQPTVGVEKLEISIKTTMDFQSSSQSESRHIENQILSVNVSRSELIYSQPHSATQQYYGECTHTINLIIPKKVQPTYQGRFITIAHFLIAKFYLWGHEQCFHAEESIRIANIIETNPLQHQLSIPPPMLNPLPQIVNAIPVNQITPITPQITPPLQPQSAPTPPPIPPIPVNYNVDISYYQNQYQQSPYIIQQVDRKHPQFYDRPFDGYNNNNNYSPQMYFNNGNYYRPEGSGSKRSSGTSTPTTEFETSSVSSSNGQIPFPTHLSPPPYRQATRQHEFK